MRGTKHKQNPESLSQKGKEMISQSSSYFTYAVNNLLIDMDTQGTFAMIPGDTSKNEYRVDIDEHGDIPVATNCKCGDRHFRHAYCKHMLVVDLFYQRIASIFKFEDEATPEEQTIPVEQAMQDAQDEMIQFYHEQTDYDALATTKRCSVTYGTCGHLAKNANEPCGACLDRMCFGY